MNMKTDMRRSFVVYLAVFSSFTVRAGLDEIKLPEETGISAAVITGAGVQFIQAGDSSFNKDTLFEIGSITKVFTALAAGMHELDQPGFLDQPIAEFIPKIKKEDVAGITPRQLYTHTSGLPRLPPSMDTEYLVDHLEDPYEDYSDNDLLRDLKRTKLKGGTYGSAYSNYGYATLGLVLELVTKREYREIIEGDILQPLGMKHSFVHYSKNNRKKVVPGHDDKGKETSHWHWEAAAPAGAIKSSAADMVLFMSKCLKPGDDALGRAMALSLEESFRIDQTRGVGLGWQVIKGKGGNIYWHNGGTGGFKSFVAMMPAANCAVVMLCNYKGVEDLEERGFALLADAMKK